ncbi:hypothetical protein M422DRAFT_32945 [Sphaerobolus stellatus SS14]|uniref:Uncharacterized protein n=1 Tax=Sphaerobolus stellatus (strain SS14) TaxID=990650 RepID=A0A0C9VC27_SPHS4|nr:hypothetical protein M422DRAFT_32945 [Sphaerobolus stellatus SS14]
MYDTPAPVCTKTLVFRVQTGAFASPFQLCAQAVLLHAFGFIKRNWWHLCIMLYHTGILLGIIPSTPNCFMPFVCRMYFFELRHPYGIVTTMPIIYAVAVPIANKRIFVTLHVYQTFTLYRPGCQFASCSRAKLLVRSVRADVAT